MPERRGILHQKDQSQRRGPRPRSLAAEPLRDDDIAWHGVSPPPLNPDVISPNPEVEPRKYLAVLYGQRVESAGGGRGPGWGQQRQSNADGSRRDGNERVSALGIGHGDRFALVRLSVP